jgi:hypothetical protein
LTSSCKAKRAGEEKKLLGREEDGKLDSMFTCERRKVFLASDFSRFFLAFDFGGSLARARCAQSHDKYDIMK